MKKRKPGLLMINRILLLLCLLLFAEIVPASDTLEIKNFSPGLVTSQGKFNLPVGAGLIAHNVDLSEKSLKIRKGYDSVYTFPGMDEFVGLYGAYYSDGQQQLVAALDSTGVGYGGLYASVMGRHDFGERYDSFIVLIDTAAINAHECTTVKFPSYCSSCGSAGTNPFQDTIRYGDSTWVLCVSNTHDSILSPSWWVDTLVTWVNSSGPSVWLTATDYGDSLTIVEDSSFLDVTLSFSFKTIKQNDVIISGPSRFWPYWSTQNPTKFETFNDMVYMVNGAQRGVVWNGDIAQPYPLPASGEPLGTPISLQSGENTKYVIDGEVYYSLVSIYVDSAWRVDSSSAEVFNGEDDHSSVAFGPLTAPMRVKDGRILLRNFQSMTRDAETGIPLNAHGDTLRYQLWRTRTNPGRITTSTKLYKTFGYVLITDDTVLVYDSISSFANRSEWFSLDSLVYIDSLPDSILTRYDSSAIFVSPLFTGQDSLGVYSRRPGAVSFGPDVEACVTCDTIWRIGDSSVFDDSPDFRGWAYAVSFIDTITGNESPLSPWAVHVDSVNDSSYYFIRAYLPPIPAGQTGVIYNLYRSIFFEVSGYADTTWTWDEVYLSYLNAYIWAWRPHPFWRSDSLSTWQPYLVAQLPADAGSFADGIRYDSLKLLATYEASEPPPRASDLFVYQNYMFMLDGTAIHRSRAEDASAWSIWDITPVNTNDGDQGIVAWPTRRGIRYKKNFTSWTIYDNYSIPEINQGWGCIASQSHIAGAFHYFLSARGIELERDGQYLERTVDGNLLSKNLKSFEGRTMADLSGMVAMYLPTEQLALFSLGDTTWAFFEKTGAWATWSMSFRGGTLYDTEDELNFVPGKTMYFYQDNDPNLYRYGKSTTDNGTNISMEWRSGIYGADRWQYLIEDVGLWVTSTDGADSTVTVTIYGDDGDSTGTIVYPALASESFILKEFGDKTPMYYFQIGITNSGSITNTAIDKIDFTVIRTDDTKAR